MKRSVMLTVALSFFILGTGCRETEEISKEQYKQVMAMAKEGFVKEGLAYGSDLPSITFKVPKWISKRVKVTIHFRTHLFCRIPQMAMKPGRIRRTAQRVIRRACRKTDVAFKDFNQAHANYGRLGLTYSEEREKLNGLLRVFSPEAKGVLKEQGITLREATKSPWPADSAILARLDTSQAERASWLAFDMGLPLGGEHRILIEVAEDGKTYLDGELVSVEEHVASIMAEDPYRLVQIIPDPQLPAGKLFEIVDTTISVGTQRMCFSDKLSEVLFVVKVHSIPCREYIEPGSGFREVLVQITNEDQVFINHEEMDYRDDNLDSILQVSLEQALSKRILIIAEENASCEKVVKLGLMARRLCKSVFPLSDNWILPRAEIGIRA